MGITSQEAWQVDTLSRSLVGAQRTAKSTGKLRIRGIRIGERRATFASAEATMREALNLRPTRSGAALVRRLLSSKFSLCVDYIWREHAANISTFARLCLLSRGLESFTVRVCS